MTQVLEQTWTLLLTRSFQAPRAAVFKCFASVEAMQVWFGPSTCKILEGKMDFRVGGKFKHKVQTNMGIVFLEGEFKEIVESEKVAFTWQWTGNEIFNSIESFVSFEFEEKDGETVMKMNHTGLENEESRDNHHHGWAGSFDKMFLHFLMHTPGRIGWTEVVTDQPETVKKFYTGLFDWQTMEMPMGDASYTMFQNEGQPIAGIQELPEEGPSRWTSYVNVKDVKASVGKAKDLGGEVLLEPMQVGEMGIMAVVGDPTGAAISLWQPLKCV